ncbi:acyl-CoA dehydrogenase family protein [Parasphingorhabdus sp.]|uniref:acyl-CoA dehydrogenase family protein n=1 Tax=Parasphingorhabdus sp. TaxID=2709688 RepID=UPI003001548F
MNLDFTPEDELFRAEARDWLNDNVPRDQRPPEDQAMREFDLAWQRCQFDGGWAGVSWPVEYGGRGLSLTEQLIWYEEYARAGGPSSELLFVGCNHAAPTIMARGTQAQKDYHLSRILRGEVAWCQGFSEPNNGSDLGGLRCRAEIDGDHLVVNGSKIWTSGAHLADWQELLVRTDPAAPKHKGISWVICDMRSPGIELRPILIMTAPGHHHFNQVFYTDVRIPLSNVVGEVNDGWNVAMSTLGFERGTASMSEQIRYGAILEKLIEIARERFGKHVLEYDEIGARLAQLRAETQAVRAMTYTTASRVARGMLGSEASITRAFVSQLQQRIRRIAVDVIGPDSIELPDVDPWIRPYLRSYSNTIAAGTSEIQRNIIGERVLGLPR